jgi:hypothetical protein
VLLLSRQIKLPEDRGAFVWHTQDSTWRYAVWLFERTLVWVDGVGGRSEIVPLPVPVGGQAWEVAAVGPRGDWVVVTDFRKSVVPNEDHGLPDTLGSIHSREGLGEIYLPVSWSSVDARGQVVTDSLPGRSKWNIQIGREVARRQWRGGKGLPFALRNQSTFHAQIDEDSKPVGREVLDVHPTRNDLALVRDEATGAKWFERNPILLPRGSHLGVWRNAFGGPWLRDCLPVGAHYSWTRLGNVLIQDAKTLKTLLAPRDAKIWSLEPPPREEVRMPPWEDARGNFWCAVDDMLRQYQKAEIIFSHASLDTGQVAPWIGKRLDPLPRETVL